MRCKSTILPSTSCVRALVGLSVRSLDCKADETLGDRHRHYSFGDVVVKWSDTVELDCRPLPTSILILTGRTVCLCVCLFIHQSTPRKRNIITQEKHSLKRIKQLCVLNAPHRAVPLTCRQNVTRPVLSI